MVKKSTFSIYLFTMFLRFLIFVLVLNCNTNKEQTNSIAIQNNSDFKSKFNQNTVPIKLEDQKRFHDCIEYGAPTPIPFYVQHKEFDYFNSTRPKFMDYGLVEIKNWPILVSYYKENDLPTEKQKVILAFRGDTSGFHKSISTQPFLGYIRKHSKNKMLFFLDEFMYLNDKDKDIKKDRIQALCHTKTLWMGYIGREWPPLQQSGNWELIDKFFPKEQKFILFTYSNGSVPRSEFVHRTNQNGYAPNFKEGFENPEKFLVEYLEKTKLTNERSKNIDGFFDIEGNFNREKPMWDTLAFLKEVVDKDSKKFFYSNARVDKPDAFPGQVLMIRALGLKGIEDEYGVIRYKNELGNIIIDIITTSYPPHYVNVGFDLRVATKFQKASDKVSRKSLDHFSMVAGVVRVFEEIKWKEE
ncbi:MAG: hypothetical protein SFU98_11190 [Leptospiraceae bacterium]|nr:hypothetical protein [Leptospiraceae bacterium]